MKTSVWKLFVNFEKEEKWLNEMAAKGFNLVHYSIARYFFQEGKPGEYIYRIELLKEMPSHPESRAYIKFMEEAGVECVDTYFRWVFFRKKAEDGSFDLYSDYDSRIKHYKRVVSLVGILGVFNLMAAIMNVVIGLANGSNGHSYFNVYISTLNWLVAILLINMFISYNRKIRKMKKEKQLYE